MIPEERAARIVYRLLNPPCQYERFTSMLEAQHRLDWNEAVAFIADQIREAVEDAILARAEESAALMNLLGQELEGLRQDLLDTFAPTMDTEPDWVEQHDLERITTL